MAQLIKNAVSQAFIYTWSPVVAASRRSILNLFARIKVGQLVIVDGTTNVTTVLGILEPRQVDDEDLKGVPRPAEAPRAELRVRSDVFWIRLLLFADMVSS